MADVDGDAPLELCAVPRVGGEAPVESCNDSEGIVGLRGKGEAAGELRFAGGVLAGLTAREGVDSEAIVGLCGNGEAAVELGVAGGVPGGLTAKEGVRGVRILSAPLGLPSFCMTGQGMEGQLSEPAARWL